MPLDTTEWAHRYSWLLHVKNCAERTIYSYLHALRGFTRFVEPRALEQSAVDDIIAYQMHVSEIGRSPSTVRVVTHALRGFFRTCPCGVPRVGKDASSSLPRAGPPATVPAPAPRPHSC